MEGKNKNKQKKGQKAVTSSFAGLRRVHRGHCAPSAGSVPCPLSAPRAPEVRAPGRAALSARRHPEPPMPGPADTAAYKRLSLHRGRRADIFLRRRGSSMASPAKKVQRRCELKKGKHTPVRPHTARADLASVPRARWVLAPGPSSGGRTHRAQRGEDRRPALAGNDCVSAGL